METIDDEKTPVKVKDFVVYRSKKNRPKKRWKKVVEKDMLERGLRRADAPDRSLQKLGCKNPLSAKTTMKTSRVPGG